MIMRIDVIASGSSGNCYRISDGKTTLLLDAGIPFKKVQIGCGFKTSNIKGCLVTHRHGDHAKAISHLAARGIAVYGPKDLQELCPKVNGLLPLQAISIGSVTVLPFDVAHDVPCFGYQIQSTETQEKLVYITDTAYVKYKFSALTHVMIEANYEGNIMTGNVHNGSLPGCVAARIYRSHMSIDTVLNFLKANDMQNVKQIYLLHLSNVNSNAERFKELVQRQTGAEVYVY